MEFSNGLPHLFCTKGYILDGYGATSTYFGFHNKRREEIKFQPMPKSFF